MFHYFLNKNFKYKKKGFKHKYTTNIKLRYSAAFVLAYLSLHNSTHLTLCTSSRQSTSAFFFLVKKYTSSLYVFLLLLLQNCAANLMEKKIAVQCCYWLRSSKAKKYIKKVARLRNMQCWHRVNKITSRANAVHSSAQQSPRTRGVFLSLQGSCCTNAAKNAYISFIA